MEKKSCCCSKMFMLLGVYGITAFPYSFVTFYSMSTVLMFMVFTMFGMAGCCYWMGMGKDKCMGTKFFMMLSKLFAFFVVMMDVYLLGVMMKWWTLYGADKFFGTFDGMTTTLYMLMVAFFVVHVGGLYKMVWSCKDKGECDTGSCKM